MSFTWGDIYKKARNDFLRDLAFLLCEINIIAYLVSIILTTCVIEPYHIMWSVVGAMAILALPWSLKNIKYSFKTLRTHQIHLPDEICNNCGKKIKWWQRETLIGVGDEANPYHIKCYKGVSN
jgi:hypothetical protein